MDDDAAGAETSTADAQAGGGAAGADGGTDQANGRGADDDAQRTSSGQQGSSRDLHEGGGPDDDAVEYPVTDSPLAPECPMLPAHPAPHTVVEWDYTEVPGGYECSTELDSRGDAATLADLIAEQLEAAGHQETSRSPRDDSADGVNTMSYLVGEGELHVTVRQSGPTGSAVHYFLVDPARGNG